jgi:hypothetical protein
MPHINVLMTCLFPALRPTRAILWLLALMAASPGIGAQDRKEATYDLIESLHAGILVMRLPTAQAKIDTLEAMRGRATDVKAIRRIEKELAKTIEDRDKLTTGYLAAMRSEYTFSDAAYVFDRELLDPGAARLRFITPRGDSIVSWRDTESSRLFLLRFERTSDSAIDALVVYGPDGRVPPDPFPSAFVLGGLSSFWNGLMGTPHEIWRIRSMNKRFKDFYQSVQAIRGAGKD